MNHQENLTAYLQSFVNELVRNGIKNAVISPGSRSTPIALLMAEHTHVNVHVHVDERSAAFYALGMAKALKEPTVLVCTSGTAAANYFPAIVEAKISRIPLIVLTADRPHELRDVGAPQAIDQINLYGNQVKWFMEMSPPDAAPEMLRYVKTVSARAVAAATKEPKGPVHLNLPFREPLIPDFNQLEKYEADDPYLQIINGELTVSDEYVKGLAARLTGFSKGIIVCGEMNDGNFSEAILELAKALDFPILADPLSQLRSMEDPDNLIVDTYDVFLRNEDVKQALVPEVIIRFGSMPVSKPLTIYMRELEALQIVVDGGAGFRDPNQLTAEMVYCDETTFCRKLIEHVEHSKGNHRQLWTSLNEKTKQEISQVADITELSEAKLFHLLADLIPDNSVLFVGNSMPIRDLDTFFHKQAKNISIYANRGANGIDGTVSTALGVGAAKRKPLYLVLGDLTFFHDMNGLIAAKQFDVPITIILINNNGGGIFSFLPQAQHPKHFELLFGTPLDLNFEHLINLYGGQYSVVENWDHLRALCTDAESNFSIRLFEIKTNRDENLKEHRQIMAKVSQEIQHFLRDEGK
ncbi:MULTISPECIES: 2-succinyl-5-enolpyruvyl-6-hydroxy-3-cyclohexene-1-carboxylic-acid synthase [Bacillaceae]|uniref:2-succinyl-5-enolpyruvyl-6-hydroxy-3- cyclohexene-1-carboxylic-acid synthase n=1 Tax=Bacillaceae TaxID=186817 RepID=UPI001E3BEEAC|nr:2-succinyl-5-enolpyruvyl-6-hydroxy-3-cyclohexene-1-carboxylic-acid synthase [Bacillus sp. Au-Bac7]MCE4051250.1 2-succinyl-5-enolpyruvyl-6-hydroxy-3-cyclohexene-1-carboxylic-acid synthase [Bacillus sp. Au-Bac7]